MNPDILRLHPHKRAWIKWATDITMCGMTTEGYPRMAVPPKPKWLHIESLHDVIGGYVVGQSYVEGLKCVYPTVSKCLELEGMDCDITWADYLQPYPTVVVVWPDEFRRLLSDRIGRRVRPLSIVHHHSNMIIHSVNQEVGRDLLLLAAHYVISASVGTITEAMKVASANSPACSESDRAELDVLMRVAINICMDLVCCGWQNKGPLDAKEWAKQKIHAKSGNARRSREAREYLAYAPQVIDYGSAADRTWEGYDPSDPTGATVRSHWRRGHFVSFP